MGWKECDRVSERLEFVKLASIEGAKVSELCRRFGISGKTGYKWLKRFELKGVEGLRDRSRRPHHSPGRTPDAVESEIVAVRRQHPSWSGHKIRRRLLRLGMESVPAASTITEILRRHGLIREESRQSASFQRFERSEPNDLWQMDFKGDFALAGKRRCYPLTLLDDHSRFALTIQACGNQRGRTVQSHLRQVFQRYGIPRAIYVDNGNPWGTVYSQARHTRFSMWLMRHDIEVIHGKPYHPQGRGKLERFHRTLQLEVLQGRKFTSLKQAQEAFEPWRAVYNQQRPHQGIQMDVPADRYQASLRSFEEQTQPYEYSARFQTRRPNSGGQIKFNGAVYRISEIYNDQPIGLCSTNRDGIWDVYYCRFRIGELDERTRKVKRFDPAG